MNVVLIYEHTGIHYVHLLGFVHLLGGFVKSYIVMHITGEILNIFYSNFKQFFLIIMEFWLQLCNNHDELLLSLTTSHTHTIFTNSYYCLHPFLGLHCSFNCKSQDL